MLSMLKVSLTQPVRQEIAMPIATVAIDLAKTVFELAAADESGKIVERRRLSRIQLERYFQNCGSVHVVMEACGTAHHWARVFAARDLRVSLLPAHYVRAYVRRNKTDSADATALLEAARASDITPVRVKSLEQQGLQGLHRIRSAWRATCTARINTLRGLCREFGIAAPLGAKRGLLALRRALAEEDCLIPAFLRATMQRLLDELRGLDERLMEVEAQLGEIARQSEICQRLQTIPGIGLIASTAFAGAVGDIGAFRSPRRFASWLGLTPREHSSGTVRRLGSISKRGDGYLRMLLVHGARAVLYSADAAVRAGRPLDALRAWGIRVRARTTHNKAAVAIANKLARIIWASWRRQRDFEFRSPQAIAA
jgi:transposase